MPSATIKLFLVHGDAKRLRTAELSNWTGKAVAGPRSELDGVLARDEAAKSGVYFLSGIDSESGKPAVYVGEAESIRDRLRGHLDKDFWNHVVFFVSKDENLTKAHIRYLEGRLIEQAKSAGRALVMNGQSSGAKLPESDREDMEIFLERIHQLMPVLGADALLPIGSMPAGHAEKQILVCEIKGPEGHGPPHPNGLCGAQGLAGGSQGACVCPPVSVYPRVPEEADRRRDLGQRRRAPEVQSVTQSSAAPVRPRPSCMEAPPTDCSRGRTGWQDAQGTRSRLTRRCSGPAHERRVMRRARVAAGRSTVRR